MPSQDKDWFIEERSEAIASLLLRSRDDVEVREFHHGEDYGVDYWVDVGNGDLFSVLVKGSMTHDWNAWNHAVAPIFNRKGKGPFMPMCMFLINVQDKRSVYDWMVEPHVKEEGRPALRYKTSPDFKELNPEAVGTIVQEVRDWYRQSMSGGFYVE